MDRNFFWFVFIWEVKPDFLGKYRMSPASILNDALTHFGLETPKNVASKQDTAERGVWSWSPLFANSSVIFFLEISKSQSLK